MLRPIIVSVIASVITFIPPAFCAPGKVTQETKGPGSPAVYVAPGGTSSIYYYNIIKEAGDAISKQFSLCLEATIAFQKEKLDDLNKKLAALYVQEVGAPPEEANRWAQDIIEKAPEFKREMERINELTKEYNKELSKNLIAKTYDLFAYIFETVDSRLMAFSQLEPKASYEKDERFILFRDETDSIEHQISRLLVLPNKNRISIRLITGKLTQGFVSQCPSLEFLELQEQKIVQSFRIKPRYGGGAGIRLGGDKVELKEERVLRDINYSATGEDMLTAQLKEQFNAAFQAFLKMAYARKEL